MEDKGISARAGPDHGRVEIPLRNERDVYKRQVCASVRIASDDGSIGTHGFVDGVVREIIEQGNSFTAVLACGPKPMLRAVAETAWTYGVPCQVSMEERMGCGVGACLVCACRTSEGHMKHVCKDGPVFDAREVDWNE